MRDIFFLVVFLVCSEAKQYFSQEPEDVSVAAGETLVLPCQVTERRGKCQWTRDGFGLGVDPSLPGFPRYSMDDDSDQGGCDLTIGPVLPTDEAVYQCQVGAVPGDQAIVSRSAQVRVVAEPGSAYIVQATDQWGVREMVQGSHMEIGRAHV